VAVADKVVTFDIDAEDGQHFAPEVRKEIAKLAPSSVNDGAITAKKLAAEAVTGEKIAPKAVTGVSIDDGAVDTAQIAAGAVDSGRLAPGAVVPDKVGSGVVTSVSMDGTPVKMAQTVCSNSAYLALTSADPNTLYFTYNG